MNFSCLSRTVSNWAGHPYTFIGAVGLILAWLALGPALGFSDTWQLYANTFTTLVTFLMCFLIQSSQDRDTRAIHAKLDELLCSIEAADAELIALEDADDTAIKAAKQNHQEQKP